MGIAASDVCEIPVRDRHHQWHTVFGAYQEARIQLLTVARVEQEMKRRGLRLPGACVLVCCRYQPDIIRMMAHRDQFSAIESHAELGWQLCKLFMLDDGGIQCRNQWARI